MSLRQRWMAWALAAPLLVSGGARAETKFAYVDLQRALQEVDEGRNAQARLKGMLEGKQKDLDREQDGLRKEKELLDKQASAMSEETRAKKTQELEKRL